MDRRTTSLSGETCSRYPKVGEVLHTVDIHEEVYDDIHIPREACAGLIGEDKVSKRKIKIGGLGAGATEGAIAPPFSTRRPTALLGEVQ